MTDLERVGTEVGGPSIPTPLAQNDARPNRARRKHAMALAAVLAAVGLAGYFGVNAVLSHPSSRATPGSTSGAFRQVRGLPRGAEACPRLETDVVVPFNAGARGTSTTTCEFVEQVRFEYAKRSTPASGPTQLSAVSPATRTWYELACLSSQTYVTCTGGSAAVIYLYNAPE